MKRVFPIIVAILLAHQIFAQITYPEKRVALAPLSFDRSTANQASGEKLYHYILDALFNTKRFTVVDRLDGYKRIVVEKKLQEGTDFIDGKVVAQGKLQGASLIIFAHVNVAQSSENKDANGKVTGYSGDLSLFVRILDVETGQVIASQIITPNGISAIGDEVDRQNSKGGLNNIFRGMLSGGCSGSNPQSALESCMSKINVHIRQFVNDNFPIEMRIYKDFDTSDGKKDFWLMGAGEGNNLHVGQKLSVIRTVLIDVGGRKLKRVDEVMKLKIADRNGEFITAQALDKKERLKEANLLATLKSDPNSIKVIELK